jgi:GTP-binding protein
LGHQFLGHIEKCSVLLHLVDGTDEDVVSSYHTVREELSAYGHKLTEKYEIIAVSKSDALDEKNANKQKEKLSLATNAKVFLLSSISGNGVRETLRTINENLNSNQNNSEPRELVDPSGTTASIGKYHE